MFTLIGNIMSPMATLERYKMNAAIIRFFHAHDRIDPSLLVGVFTD